MSRPRLSQLATALALGGLTPATGAAQSAPAPAALALTTEPAPVPRALKAAYHVLLTSAWPQETAGGCRNGGTETVEGTLTRNADGTYAGSFVRRTDLLFCGAHGAAAESCALTLAGRGTVAMTGVVMDDEASPSGRSVRVTWIPAPGHKAAVSGACPAGFKDAVREMYLSTPHAAEFPLTAAGAGPRTERLENYAWTVELN